MLLGRLGTETQSTRSGESLSGRAVRKGWGLGGWWGSLTFHRGPGVDGHHAITHARAASLICHSTECREGLRISLSPTFPMGVSEQWDVSKVSLLCLLGSLPPGGSETCFSLGGTVQDQAPRASKGCVALCRVMKIPSKWEREIWVLLQLLPNHPAVGL